MSAARTLGAAALAGTLAALAVAAAPTHDGYRSAAAPYTFHFPRDHAAHPSYRTEWWYYTGQLAAPGRAFGFELTLFRIGIDRARERSRSAWAPHTLYVVHAALTDETHGRFDYDEAAERPALRMAGSDSTHYRVWIGADSAGLGADGRTHELHARMARFGFDLELAPVQPPAIHGREGVSVKGAARDAASHYYSLPRLGARGVVRTGHDTVAVSGEAWMDHEFGSGALSPGQVGWDWFALRLVDGRDVMLYVMRGANGVADPASSGSLIAANGTVRHLDRSAFDVTSLGRWRSPHSGAEYPSGWRVRVPSAGIDVNVVPSVRDQELVSRELGGVTYWEGSVGVRQAAGGAAAGRGYVELTGYAGAPPGR